MRFVEILWWCAGAAALSGCGGGDLCTLELRQSVTMTVTRADGAPLEDVMVRFRVDDGPLREAACFRDMDGYCTQWVAGEEEEGLFEIEAVTPTGTTTTLVLVTGDECHVDTQHVELVVE